MHVHVRDDDGTPSADQVQVRGRHLPDPCALVHAHLREHGWGGRDEPRASDWREPIAAPDAVGVETGSLNFGETPFITTPAETARGRPGRTLVRQALGGGGVRHRPRRRRGIARRGRGLCRSGTPFNLVFGVQGGAPPTASALARWSRTCRKARRGPSLPSAAIRRRCCCRALLMDAPGIRVGFEDNVYLKKRRARAARMRSSSTTRCRWPSSSGGGPAGPAECRAYFGLEQPGPAAGDAGTGRETWLIRLGSGRRIDPTANDR